MFYYRYVIQNVYPNLGPSSRLSNPKDTHTFQLILKYVIQKIFSDYRIQKVFMNPWQLFQLCNLEFI